MRGARVDEQRVPGGGALALYGVQESVRNILHIARLDEVFRLFPDRAAAEAAVSPK